MSAPTEAKPGDGGFHAFDHRRFADWPEYADLARALDAFAQRCAREEADLSQAEFEALAVTIARHLLASDGCQECIRDGEPRICAPIANAHEDGTVAGLYRCPRGHVWECFWSQREHLAAVLP